MYEALKFAFTKLATWLHNQPPLMTSPIACSLH